MQRADCPVDRKKTRRKRKLVNRKRKRKRKREKTERRKRVQMLLLPVYCSGQQQLADAACHCCPQQHLVQGLQLVLDV